MLAVGGTIINTYVKIWLTWTLAVIVMISVVFFADGWTRIVGTLIIIAVITTWPRCPRCRLPVYWTKSASAPDNFAMYRPRLSPGRTCARCGQELDL